MTDIKTSENQDLNRVMDSKIQNSKVYDLEERTYEFAERVNEYVNQLPDSFPNREKGRQLVRSGGSIGANYIEANEALGKKDFLMKIKISKKESKESRFWLRLTIPNEDNNNDKKELIQEATELMNIFGSILHKSRKKQFKLKY